MSYDVVDDLEPPRMTPAVQALIALNVIVYFVQATVVGTPDMQGALGFQLRDLQQWWTIVTYMFVHDGFWHLALNMYTLWLFGRRVEQAWTPGSFARYYIWCGLGGWFFHLLFFRDALLIGSTAAVVGVMLAYAMRWPDDEILLFGVIPMRVKWLVIAMIFIDVMSGVLSGGATSSFAYASHLGGLAAGWLYLRTPSAQGLERLKQRVSALPDTGDEPPRAVPRSPSRPRERGDEVDEVVARSRAVTVRRPAALPPASGTAPASADALDQVLEKIHEQGIQSLTPAERKLLEDRSKKLRG